MPDTLNEALRITVINQHKKSFSGKVAEALYVDFMKLLKIEADVQFVQLFIINR